MAWELALLVIMGSVLFMMTTGLPIAFCFVLVNLMGAFFFWGGGIGVEQLVINMAGSLTLFALLPVPLFILMGEVLFQTGTAPLIIDAIDKWMGRVPGRLSLVAVGAGTVIGFLSGASMASVAMLGSTLVPEMEKRGYKNPMSLGPILGAGALDTMIPPSGLAVLMCAIGVISVGKLLIAIIIPGLVMAAFYAVYIVVRAWLQPHLAPPFETPPIPLSQKLMSTAKYILPSTFVIFMVIGVMMLGIVTPTEAAGTGALASLILVACYGRLNWETAKRSFVATFKVTVMLFMIICGASTFAQNLAYTGATRGFIELAVGLNVPSIVVIIMMQIIMLMMGCFMDTVGIMMITLPIYVPVVKTLGFDLVWFGAIMLLNLEMATVSPPYGTALFTLKGVAPHVPMGDIYKAGFPFLGMNLIVMGLMLAFPPISLWLPSYMMR